jgi:glycosyltransferase involved in cell wall biosynthesis
MNRSVSTYKLAIVIPVYKIKYFKAMLESIASQTNQEFNVYIGNDCSTPAFEKIIADFPQLNISYKRFSENMGKRDLVGQWERCVEMSGNEPWIWMFSDDDIMDANCVEAFYTKINTKCEESNLFKFQSAVINDAGKIIESAREIPHMISGFDLILMKIRGEIKTYVTDYVFSRKVYEDCRGFNNFPLAWGADDTSWVKFAGEHGIEMISSGTVYWRTSGENISNVEYSGKKQKVFALLMYSEWNIRNFKNHPSVNKLKAELQAFFFDQLRQYKISLSPIFHLKVFLRARKIWDITPRSYFSMILR